jgi:hypothetical protein
MRGEFIKKLLKTADEREQRIKELESRVVDYGKL